MSRISNQIALSRPVLRKFSPCPPEINELILKFAQWPDEPYHREDISEIPENTTRTFMLRMKIGSPIGLTFYQGNVEIIRRKCSFEFTVDGAHYETDSITQCYNDLIILYLWQPSPVTITLLSLE